MNKGGNAEFRPLQQDAEGVFDVHGEAAFPPAPARVCAKEHMFRYFLWFFAREGRG